MRLLSEDEIIRDTEAIRKALGVANVTVFWTDDNSNYAGVFVDGPLAGMVTLIDHEEPLLVPSFTSVASFVAAFNCHGEVEWTDLTADLPAPASTQANQALQELFLARYASDPDDEWSAHVALQFLSRDDTRALRSLMMSDAMWVQERACRLAGAFGMDELCGDLETVARQGMQNGRLASIRALQTIATPSALESLARLEPALGPDYAPYFRRQK